MKNRPTARRGGDIFIISEPTAMLFTSAQLNSSIIVTLFAVLAIPQRFDDLPFQHWNNTM